MEICDIFPSEVTHEAYQFLSLIFQSLLSGKEMSVDNCFERFPYLTRSFTKKKIKYAISTIEKEKIEE